MGGACGDWVDICLIPQREPERPYWRNMLISIIRRDPWLAARIALLIFLLSSMIGAIAYAVATPNPD
jgi:hypothetical protein